jgi:hypothetical protein
VVLPPDDRPDPAKGEISSVPTRVPVPETRASEPTILVADLAPPIAVADVAPATLVEDMAAARTAVSAVVATQAAAPPTTDIASASRELAVSDVRKDAVAAFSDVEEEFFRAGSEKHATAAVPKVAPESFDDLDEGYQPVGFWDRVRGKKPPTK